MDKISDVFRTVGQPTITYVQRDSGTLERRLASYLDEAGQLCLITGPSKTGKTTLYKQVLNSRGEIPLVVQCTGQKSSKDIWKEALEGVNFERVKTTTATTSGKSTVNLDISAEGGTSLLAKLAGKLGLSREDGHTESEIREKILSDPSPDILIPILKNTNFVLVIEDFHYLEDKEKVNLFQQWKRFVDSEITILVLGTTHRAVDIANSNRDLVGRIAQIDVGQWSNADLKKICEQGFSHLKAECSSLNNEYIATEAVGLPIVVQQACLELFIGMGIVSVKEARKRNANFDKRMIRIAFHEVAKSRYTQFNSYYDTLIRGPREKARVYKTYELVLACFTVDPIQFSLTRSEIDRRLDQLVKQSDTRPPAASVNSTLGALRKFQEGRGFRLLEWRPNEDKLYIVEPAFLFFVRWRHNKNEGEQLDLFELLLRKVASSLQL